MSNTRIYTACHLIPWIALAVAACGESKPSGPQGSSTTTAASTLGTSSSVGPNTSTEPVPTTSALPTTSAPAPAPTVQGPTGGTGGTTSGGDTAGATAGATSDAPAATSDPVTTTTADASSPAPSSSGPAESSDDDSANPQPSSATLHVFMLMGQSNMAGVAKAEASDKVTDERIKVWGGCNQPAGQWNLAKPPLSDCPGEKGWNLSDSVDPGTWFAKTLVTKLPAGDTIGLIGTAESGESINTFISGGVHHQMILNKIAQAKTTPNARFAGVIFHQGESDNGQDTWPGKVVQLYNEVKAAWGVTYDVPFILGELPAGGCCSLHNAQVRQAAAQLPMGAWVSQEGTAVLDEYHFDHASVILMGQRYGEKMIEALGW